MAKTLARKSESFGGLGKETLGDFLRQMYEIRFFEEKVAELLKLGIIKGASHLYAGQEAVAVGAISAITEDDVIASTHRGHGHCGAIGDKHAQHRGRAPGPLEQDDGRADGQGHRLLQGPRRLDAHRGRREGQPRLDRHRRRQHPDRHRRGAGREAQGHGRRRALLLRRRRDQHRQLPRSAQHGRDACSAACRSSISARTTSTACPSRSTTSPSTCAGQASSDRGHRRSERRPTACRA